MADEFGDGEFWLPSEFLSDDVVIDKTPGEFPARSGEGHVWFPNEFPYGESELSSPVESVLGSSETESDGEDFAAFAGELSRQLSSSLVIDADHRCDVRKPKVSLMSSSPQSPLCGMGNWSRYGHGNGVSSRSSSNGASQLSSPPSTPYHDAWDLLSAAAGEVVRLKQLNEEVKRLSGRGVLGCPPRKPASTGYYSNPTYAHQQLLTAKLQQLQTHQWEEQRRQGGVWSGRNGGKGGRQQYPLSSSAWPPLQSKTQQQPSAGMQAVFLAAGAGPRRESAGTGVFLPRRPGVPIEQRKKPACSTVLMPARVVQALNLNIDEMSSARPHLPRTNGQHTPRHLDQSWLPARSEVPLSMLQKNAPSLPTPASISLESRLPSEWTY